MTRAARALSYNYSMLSLPDGQCGYLTPYYIVLGPFGLHIWNEFDPVTGRLVAWKIGAWVDRDVTTIWMDGRPHPSPKLPRTYAGFTTGRWEGDTLVTTTTHMKASMIRRNGAPVSDQATMTMTSFRHGDLLTIRAVMDDPVLFLRAARSEPRLGPGFKRAINLGNGVASPVSPSRSSRPPTLTGVVPHYLPGQNPFVKELTEKHNIPVEAVLGGAETMYPEYRKSSRAMCLPRSVNVIADVAGLVCPASRTGAASLNDRDSALRHECSELSSAKGWIYRSVPAIAFRSAGGRLPSLHVNPGAAPGNPAARSTHSNSGRTTRAACKSIAASCDTRGRACARIPSLLPSGCCRCAPCSPLQGSARAGSAPLRPYPRATGSRRRHCTCRAAGP